jgi:hypothetical protein
MRVLAILFLLSAILAPGLAAADPAQPEATTANALATAVPSATAQSAQATAPVAPSTASADAGVNLDDIVCRNSPPATGTRLGGGRECHTVRQWNEREREDQELLRRQQGVGAALSGDSGKSP